MSSTARAASEPPPLDSVYPSRDDIAQTYPPANAYERMLVTAAAQAWARFQQAQELERRVFEKTDPLELFSTNMDAFKTITRYVANCERAFRQATYRLEATQRARRKATGFAPRLRNVQNVPNRTAAAAVVPSPIQSQPSPVPDSPAATPKTPHPPG